MKYPISDNLIINEETLPVISQLAESIPGGFFIYHADGAQELIYFNSHLPAIFGCDTGDEFRALTGNSFRGIVHPDDYAENESDILSQIKENSKNNDHVRYRFIRKDGSVGMMDDYGHFSHSDTFGDIYYVFVQDITEQYREEREHRENINRIMAREDDFGCLYDVDLETGNYAYYVNNNLLSEEYSGLMEYREDFFEDTVRNARQVVYPEDREGVIRVLGRDFIIRTLETESSFDWYYRLLAENEIRWARVRVVYKDKEKKHVIVGAFNAEAEMEAKEKAEQLQKELINTFKGSYETVFLANTDDDSYTIISGTEYLNGFFPEGGVLSEELGRYLDEALYPPDRVQLKKKLSLSTKLRNAFYRGEVYSYEYRRCFTGRNIWYRVTFNRFSGNRILVGFENCDREYTYQIISDKLMSDYDGIYIVSLERGKLRPIKISSASRISFDEDIDYTAAVRDFAETVEPEYRQDWLNFSDIEFMKAYMANSDHREFVYELPDADRVMRRFSIDILERDSNGNASLMLHSFAGIDDDRAAVIRLNRQLAQHRSLLEYFMDQYWSACFIDLANDTLEVIRADNANTSAYIMDGTHEDMERFIYSHFHPDDIELMLKITDKSFVKNELRDKASLSYTAREIINGEVRTMRVIIVRCADEDHVAVGFMDVTREILEQQKRLLGAMPLSNDVLDKANIGLWAFELDEGQPPRMYDDQTMLKLVGLEHQVTPEEAYHAWYDNIDAGSYELVNDAVAKMMDGEHAEVQYPWHYPDGRTIIVRCGGIRNYEYTKGIRIEGTHQDVTQTLHFDEKAERRRQIELEAAEVRAEMLAFISDNKPDVDSFMRFFGERVIKVLGCDQFIFRDMNGHRIVVNAEGIEDIPQRICSECPFVEFRGGDYGENGIVHMDDCENGYRGILPHPECPAKSSYMEKVYSDDKPAGLLSVHYLRDRHEFTENDIDILTTVRTRLGLLLMRIAAQKADMERMKAESANAAKTDFLFNMSHDIRTPMNAIIGFTNIAKKEIDNRERALDSLEKVQTSSDILLNLINDVLDMSRIESGKVELHEERSELIAAFDSFEPAMASLAAAKDIDLRFSIGTVRDRFIYMDGPRFDRILINIISNAIKYTPAEGSVRVTAEQIEDTAPGYGNYRFTVADTGIGMSEEFQKHMYENFSREYNATTREVQGTGLGLSLAKRLAELMGGSISCVSAQGEGTTFTLVFPFRLQTAEDIAERPDDAQERTITELRGKRALLAEDNALNREIAEEILSEEGIIVETAADGQQAVDRVTEHGAEHYDFILMDIQMPVMDGYEATRTIRRLMPELRAPIIALSANAFAEDRRKSLEAGMDDHVAKPIDIKELFGALARFMK